MIDSALLNLLTKDRQLKVARKLAAAEQWDELLARDAKHGMTAAEPKTLPIVLLAALEREKHDRIAALIGTALSAPMEQNVALAASSLLLAWNRPEQAWQFLKIMDRSAPSNRMIALYHRVSLKAEDPVISGEALHAYKEILGASTDSARQDVSQNFSRAAQLAPYEFPGGNTPAATTPRGKISILERAGLNPQHKATCEKLLEKFDESLQLCPPPQVFCLENVIVNRFGQIWKDDGEMLAGSKALPPEAEWRDAPEIETGILSTNATKGFFHWYAEHFPALAWRMGTEAPKAPILLGTHAASFCDRSLQLAGCQAAEIIRIDNMRCRKLFVPRSRLACLADWQHFGPLYDAVAEAAQRAAGNMALPPYIYISRRDTQRRVMKNEIELEAALQNMGIKPVIMSALSLEQQVQLVRHARLIVAPHGAGLTHIVNAVSGLKILEIMPVQQGSHALRFNFARISRMRGHDHTMWLEPINTVTGSWSVDIPAITRLAQEILATT